MATGQHRHQLSRLAINGPPYHQVPLYSPAIQTAFHQTFPSSLLQTPVQPSFFPPPSGPPHRPLHHGHRHQPSLALASAGIHPPPGIPLTPGAFSGTPQFPPFQPRSRRQPSVSTGGPPKAQLGGAGKNYRPPSPTAAAQASVVTQGQKGKKATVNLPKETVPSSDGEPSTRTPFARTPIPPHLVPPQPPIPPPDVTSAVIHPEDSSRVNIPDAIDVFLPSRSNWDAVKKQFIEEKLEKLGVEKGTGSYSNVPHIHAPHARAASISSPADPALLYFKLNKLQQAQNSQPHSPSLSPHPPPQAFGNGTPPPPIIHHTPPPSGPLRHGHSLSLAAPPFMPSRHYLASNNFNPFGPGASLGLDVVRSPDARSDPGAPTDQSLAPPAMPARADSRPDFVRGFGLDVTEEVEEEAEQDDESFLEGLEEDQALAEASHIALAGADDSIDMELDVDEADAEVGSITTAAQSRVHSRHVSRFSAAFSLRSLNGHLDDSEPEVEKERKGDREGDPEDDAIGEWTGSEETADDEESIGEWSNPSDEERARQDRQQRRLMRRAHHQQPQESTQVPRRIPNFPHPPANPLPLTALLSQPRREAEDDMISNPSDDDADRPHALHLPPSSRPPSSRLPMHDTSRAHSRAPSNNFVPTPFQMPMPIPIQAPVPKRTDVLNPHAKPFVFGGPARLSGSFTPGTLGPQAQQPPLSLVPQPSAPFGHARGASLGKPLNAGATEFKPNTFTFTPPPDVPKFPLAPPALPSPPPLTNVDAGVVRAQQGREKRQRRGSAGSVSASETSEDGMVVMTSFKFPQESPARKSAPPSPAQRHGPLNAAVRPLALPGLGGIDFSVARESAARAESPVSDEPRYVEGDEDGVEGGDEDEEHELPVPLSMKARRAPIPLDFKHPVSTNTVPAGLFKALANGSGGNSSGGGGTDGEERTHHTVRNRLTSREIFEHASRPSLDDLHVPAISRKASRGRLITDPGRWDGPTTPREPSQLARDRRASLPAMGSAHSSLSDTSIHPPDISRRLELQHYEERLEALLESKLDDFREEVRALRLEAGAAGSASTEAAINEVVSLFRAQLQESAARGLDDSQMDARGELDFQLVKDIVEQGHAEARAVIQQELDRILRCVEALQSPVATPINGGNTEAVLEEYHTRTHDTLVAAVAPIAARLESLERTRSHTPLPAPPAAAATADHEAMVRELNAVLVPRIAAMRAEPIDYELLTERLSQAVKPHISQLIDLASDKRETAGLIVDRLIPVLPSIYPPARSAIDVPEIVAQVAAEVRRIVAPLDAHEIKEQVSDLVVERLDSRLAVRDRLLDGLSSKLVGGLDDLAEPVKDVAARVEELVRDQGALSVQTRDATALLSGLPEQLAGATEPLRAMLVALVSAGLPSSEDLVRIGSAVESLSAGQQVLQDKTAELLSRLTDLPEGVSAAIATAQHAHAELLARAVTKEDFEEVRMLMATNADLQVQLNLARAQFGAVRAEKDVVIERLAVAESERDRLRAKVDEVQLLRERDAEMARVRARELEDAISQSLARLKTSDVTIEGQQERVRDLTAEKEALVSRVHALETQAGFESRDREALASLRKDHDELLAQQTHWEELRRTTEQVGQLAALLTQAQTADSELKELRHIRDRSQVLEGENAALQRRATASERATSAARTSLVQAQQRATEWEQRANEHADALREAEAALRDADDRAAQLEADHSLAQMELQDKDAEERLAKDRESKLRDQVAALEARLAAQVQQANGSWTKKAAAAADFSLRPEAVAAAADLPSRPGSRASTVYPSRAATPTASVNGRHRTSTPPRTSVWDSMHAPTPTTATRYARPHAQAEALRRAVVEKRVWSPRVASPTPSVVSVTPTLGDDGWYE